MPAIASLVMAAVALLVMLSILSSIARILANLLNRVGRPLRESSGNPRGPTAAGAPPFTPLTLTDAGLRWPSETPWNNRTLPLPPWPSETWTNSPFARAPGSVAPPIAPPTPAAPATSAKSAAPQKPENEKRKKKGQKKATNSGAPDAAEILAVAEQQGLAAAAELIRSRTGWPFATAAQYLAEVLRNDDDV
jgi:hypothetical protein